MTLYWRTSTFVDSAARRAGASIFVLNPMTTAPDAAASVRSDSVMSPTPSWMIWRPTSCCGIFAIAPVLRDERLRGLFVGDGAEHIARLGHVGQAEDLDRSRGLRPADVLALVVRHGAHAAEGDARDDEVAALERAVLHQDRRDRAAARVHVRLDNVSHRGTVGLRLQLGDVGDEEHDLEELLDALLRARGDRAERRVSAVLLDRHVVLRTLS